MHHSTSRHPWRAFALTAAVLAILTVAAGAAADTLTRDVDRTFRLNPGGNVVLENVNGNISVETWDRDRVELHLTKTIKASDRQHAEQAMQAFQVDIESTPERLRVEVRKPEGSDGIFAWLRGAQVQYSAAFVLKVPRQVDLRATTVNGRVDVADVDGELGVETVNGKIVLDRVAGRIDVSTVNGSVHVADARGAVSAETVNGGISVEMTRVSDDADMRFSTVNGGVHLSLPPDVHARLDARTTNGGISTDFPVEVHGKWHSKSVDADLNGGGGRLEVRSTNGGIKIEKI